MTPISALGIISTSSKRSRDLELRLVPADIAPPLVPDVAAGQIDKPQGRKSVES